MKTGKKLVFLSLFVCAALVFYSWKNGSGTGILVPAEENSLTEDVLADRTLSANQMVADSGEEEETGQTADISSGNVSVDRLSSLRSEQQGKYAYETMDASLQQLYLEILDILNNRAENVDISTTDLSSMDMAFQCVLTDHPEIFYVKGYTYTKFTRDGKITRISFSGTYSMDSGQIASNREKIEQYAASCLAGVPEGADEYTKVKYIYEYLIDRTEYNLTAAENQNICSVFLYGQSVCQGYAKAMQFLLGRLGVFSTLVTGTVENGEGHAWNMVSIDGSYYYVDATWGDAFYEFDPGNTVQDSTTGTGEMPSINYDYLCVTTDQLTRTHRIDNVVPLPRCVSLQNNYYVKENAYFTQADEAAIQNLFQKAYEEGKNYITMKCADRNVYQEIKNILIEKQKVFEYLQGRPDSVAYTGNEAQMTLSFWL